MNVQKFIDNASFYLNREFYFLKEKLLGFIWRETLQKNKNVWWIKHCDLKTFVNHFDLFFWIDGTFFTFRKWHKMMQDVNLLEVNSEIFVPFGGGRVEKIKKIDFEWERTEEVEWVCNFCLTTENGYLITCGSFEKR